MLTSVGLTVVDGLLEEPREPEQLERCLVRSHAQCADSRLRWWFPAFEQHPVNPPKRQDTSGSVGMSAYISDRLTVRF